MKVDVMKQTYKNSEPYLSNFENLLKRMADGNHPHLEVFLSRKKNDHTLPQDFLYVDPYSFGKVRVNDLWYCDDKICIEVQDSSTGTDKEIIVDVKAIPDFLMVNWDDVVRMVRKEYNSSTSGDQLLDFDF